MLTLETKITRELQAIEKLEIKTVNRLRRIKAMLGDEKPPVSISETLKNITPSVRRSWGPGRKIPAEVKLEILAMLKEGKKPKEISPKAGVSIPSIQKIKEEAGLVKRRSLFSA
jgi:hypothetical protein